MKALYNINIPWRTLLHNKKGSAILLTPIMCNTGDFQQKEGVPVAQDSSVSKASIVEVDFIALILLYKFFQYSKFDSILF
jgi:hypothetical protein